MGYVLVIFDYNNYLYLNFFGRSDWFFIVEKENNNLFYFSVSLFFILIEVFGFNDLLNFLKLCVGFGILVGFLSLYSIRSMFFFNVC